MPKNRLYLLAGAGVLAAIVVVVAIVVGTSGGSKASTTTTAPVTGTTSMFAGVPQHNDVLGDPNAPVTLEVFEDPQCPYCRQWNLDTLQTVIDDYVRPGKVKLRYRGIVVIGVNSVAGLRAIYAAGRQNKLWNMTELLYRRQGAENSGWITVPVIKDAARDVGANAAKVVADADAAAITAELNQGQRDARAAQVNGTPTFVVLKPLGAPVQLQVSGLEPDQFTPALDAALQ